MYTTCLIMNFDHWKWNIQFIKINRIYRVLYFKTSSCHLCLPLPVGPCCRAAVPARSRCSRARPPSCRCSPCTVASTGSTTPMRDPRSLGRFSISRAHPLRFPALARETAAQPSAPPSSQSLCSLVLFYQHCSIAPLGHFSWVSFCLGYQKLETRSEEAMKNCGTANSSEVRSSKWDSRFGEILLAYHYYSYL